MDDVSLGRCVPETIRLLKHWDSLSLCWVRLSRTVEAQGGIHYTNIQYCDKYLDAVQGQDASVRDATAKERIDQGTHVKGTEHPRLFVWRYIGRGHFDTSSFF